MAKVLVGPVVGKVTDSEAHILVEVDALAKVTCKLVSDTGETSLTYDMAPPGPRTFHFTGLEPEQRYEIVFEGVDDAPAGRFRTFAKHPRRLTLAVVSCNFTVRRGDTDLWADLYHRFVEPEKIDMVLHVGDQIYGDQAFSWCVDKAGGAFPLVQPIEEQCRERYRELYRLAWRHPATRDVLACVPNLMIWDDHEIRDDWGSNPADSDPGTVEHYVGGLARGVYREYQRQLWDTLATDDPASGFEDHIHVFGDVGVLFVDQRGGRSFETDLARPYLGSKQWARIAEALGPGGAFDAVRALVVVTSVPLAYLGMRVTNAGVHVFDDLHDHWAFGSHRMEQVEFVRALRNWKQAPHAAASRDLIVLGGDVHLGAHTEIKHEGNTVFRQLITSPITNKPPSWFQTLAMRGLLELDERLTASYSFEHSDVIGRRNFGIVVVRVPDEAHDPVKIEGSLAGA
ncbi:MAG: alkaline phosphatase family protein [Myxococcales bacterium]|nr:alkaline phosphatase family protein [Myxococcales bacterium]